MQVDFKANPVARRVQKRGQIKKAHYAAPVNGGGQLLQMESRLEASAAIALGLDPRVLGLRSQPVCLDLATGREYGSKEMLHKTAKERASKPMAYTPDFAVTLANEVIFIEVKHSSLIAKNPKILSYPGILARYGHRLIIIDETILPETFNRNLRLLSIYRRLPIEGTTLERLAQDVAQGTPFMDLTSAGYAEAAILGALARGNLTCDLHSERISRNTVVQTAGALPLHLMELPLEQ